jgi:hypothetical protein
VFGDAHEDSSSAADDAGGHVQQVGSAAFRFGLGQYAVQQGGLGQAITSAAVSASSSQAALTLN